MLSASRVCRGGLALHVLPDEERAAEQAAAFAAERVREAVKERGRCVLAVSGGRSPEPWLQRLAEHALPWPQLAIFQVDERVAPAGDAARNWLALQTCLLERAPGARAFPMPVEAADLARAAREYEVALEREAGCPPLLDLVHLGVGGDGHTASLFPADPLLDANDASVAPTAEHAGFRRMTLTLPVLNRARSVLWFITGAQKQRALGWLCAGVPDVPANRVRREAALVFCDRSAAG